MTKFIRPQSLLKISKSFVFVENKMYLCRRMKKVFTYSVTFLMAVLVFYGGAGVNLISYCCKLCRHEGIEAVLKDKCCDIHHHHADNKKTHHHASGCCDSSCDAPAAENPVNIPNEPCNFPNEHASGNVCSFERINFDWSAQNFSKQETEIYPIKQHLFSCNFLALSPVDQIKTGKIHSHIPHGPPKVLPCDYLSILTVLLI